jgi:hypothetical protein
MYFSEETLYRIQSEFALLKKKHDALILGYYPRKYHRPETIEHVQHGFMRRLGTLLRCVQNTFSTLPPDRGDDPPTRDERIDATINIQAFVFNIFGAIDNLAWIWVTENALKKEDGSPLPNQWIGLGPKNVYVRNSFSKEFRNHLTSMNSWFEHLENFRHALAHRIPLYIPPYTVSPEREGEWQQLEKEIFNASMRGDSVAESKLKESQRPLCKFKPLMLHSYSEKSRPVVFHAQLIADFLTLEELALRLLAELPPPPG